MDYSYCIVHVVISTWSICSIELLFLTVLTSLTININNRIHVQCMTASRACAMTASRACALDAVLILFYFQHNL